jgi:hypothetical protein
MMPRTPPLPLAGRGRGWGSGQLALLCPTARPPPHPSPTRGRESHAIDGRATSSSARCKVIRRRDGPLPAFFRPSRGGRLEVLEFPCFFRGISFCQNAGGAGRKPFRPGVKRRCIRIEERRSP